jgi:transposase
MSNILTPTIRSELLKRHRNERDGKIRDRIKAILLRDDGLTYVEIARVLFLSDEGVRKQVEDYIQHEKLELESGGTESKLNAEQTEALITYLEENTYLKVKDIIEYAVSTYAIKYSISGMTGWLKSHNFSHHKPAVVPAKADKDKQKLWLDDYNKLRNYLPSEDHIVFYDGVHPTHAVRAVRGWIRKGTRKELPTNSGQRRMNILGALNLETMSIFTKEYKTIDATSSTDFFDYLQEKIPEGNIHVVLDQARYNKCKETLAYVDANPRIKLRYLPPYSPNLNAIEPCWKIMHEHVTNNKYYASFNEFNKAVVEFLSVTFAKKANQWVDRLTDNFRLMNSPLLTNF